MQSLRTDAIEVGSLRAFANAHSLTLRSVDSEEPSELSLDLNQVAELFRFLRSVISPADRRNTHRLPIPEAGGFRATIHLATEAIPAEAKNLSLTGILLLPASPNSAGLKLGATVRVLLEFDGESVIAESTIQRRTGSEYGLSFLDSGSGDELDPLPGLSRIMMKLERYWVMEAWKA